MTSRGVFNGYLGVSDIEMEGLVAYGFYYWLSQSGKFAYILSES